MNRSLVSGMLFLGVLALFCSCDEEKMLVPKPPSYLRTDHPPHTYHLVNDDCPYSFELSEVYNYKTVQKEGRQTCHKDIQLGSLNGIIHFSYIDMDEPLKVYLDYALDKVEEHQIKADAIDDTQIIRPDANVYGTLFELKGDVASPFQFYLTDSTDRFVSAVVYFNVRPNYDSLRPSLDYLKKDLLHLMNTFEWKK